MRAQVPHPPRLHDYLSALAAAGEEGLTLAELARRLRLRSKRLSGLGSVLGAICVAGLCQRHGRGAGGRVRISSRGRDWLASYQPSWSGHE